MSRAAKDEPSRRLIDEVAANAEFGAPRAALVTTFDLAPEFFEVDFLPSLLGTPSWDDHRRGARVQLEAELARMDAVAVLMEGRRYQGRPRSLRVHVRPAIAPHRGVLHAKVALVVHDDAVRLLVSSANLTTSGYRLNREVALALRATRKHPEEGALIAQALLRMPQVLGAFWSPTAQVAIEAAQGKLAELGVTGETSDEWFVWGGDDEPLWRKLVAAWPEGERISRIRIVSPFWSDAQEGGALGRLLGALRTRGASMSRETTRVELVASALPDTTRSYRPALPTSYSTFDFRELGVTATVTAASPRIDAEDAGRDDLLRERPLHAKVLLLDGPETRLAYLGSANFTLSGWGFGAPTAANVEAGVLLRRRGRERAALEVLVPPTLGGSWPLEGGGRVVLADPPLDEPPSNWPSFIVGAELRPSEVDSNALALFVELAANDAPAGWQLALEPDTAPIAGMFASPAAFVVALDAASLRTVLRQQAIYLSWPHHTGAVAFPVNVSLAARAELPFGDPEVLPRESDLVAFYQGRIALKDLFPDPGAPSPSSAAENAVTDATGVDTSKILSYQIRAFVEALPGLRDELARQTATESSMRLALLGPVSPRALGREIERAVASGRSSTAAGFQLVELLRCLDEARALEVSERLRPAWEAALREVSRELMRVLERLRASNGTLGASTSFDRYARAILGAGP